ncbi:chromate transporter [Oceanicoccus sp. KOV_DT_Chl]|uniref:chromate transporter n=1 Tax=Oceanicoccus sp. KOV_DT_Chl TaxID=1904639 RepID=UPI001F2D9118|nr:chromate transporter [Oceanicoccus sp. KOV_DT_Chl]
MFLPGLLLVAAVLPLWQMIAIKPLALNAVAGVNAAVVGMLAAALYDPVFTAGITSITDCVIAGVAFAGLKLLRLSLLYIVIWCVLASVLALVV